MAGNAGEARKYICLSSFHQCVLSAWFSTEGGTDFSKR